MTTVSTNKVLKEWASVCDALATGRQIILFRKGGIIEQHDRFEVESPSFYLYPTYLHQRTEDLQPDYQPLIAQSEAKRTDDKHVDIRYFATVDRVVEAKNIARLQTLDDAYIWNSDYVERAWSWAPQKPAYLLFLRTYVLNQPCTIADKPEYGGCVSWVDLVEPLTTDITDPVLTDAVFEARCQSILNVLADSVTAPIALPQ